MHKKAPSSGSKLPEGTYDPFEGVAPGVHKYTGSLRATYPIEPVPKRTIPDSIPKPDYARQKEGISYAEAVASRTMKMGKIHTLEEIDGMRVVCKLAREVLDLAAAALKPGITTLEIDELVHKLCIERDSYPSPLNYRKFPRSVCTSVNEVICHGIPDARPLEDGDIVNLDVTLFHKGYHGDVNGTYPVGNNVSEQNLNLIATTRRCLDESMRIVKPGTLFRDVGNVIEPIAKEQGFSTNRTYVGHGINHLFHCPPNIAHYAGSKTAGEMKAGMIFTIEPMICTGNQQAVHWADNWTAVTSDGKPSAQFEETMLVTADGVEVLTAAPGWTFPPTLASKGKEKEVAKEEGKVNGTA
ncbi:methionine aminopeptidase [Meredithblackwellia eburnea MCA 4105]